MQNFSTPLLVVAAALIGPDGRVLMHRRALASVHGGLWEFPGGKVFAAETPEIALIRELREELDIMVEQADLAPLGFATGDTADKERPLVILLYTCRSWAGEPRCVEGEAIAWHRPGDIASLDMPPLDYPLAKQLFTSISPKAR